MIKSAYRHVNGCGEIAFYLNVYPKAGDPIPNSQDVYMPDGTHPKKLSAPACGVCGKRIKHFTRNHLEEVKSE